MGRYGEAAVSCSAIEFSLLDLPFAETEGGSDALPLSPSLGKILWTLNPNSLSNGTLAAPVVVLPDLDEDGVRDLVVLAIGELQVRLVSSDGHCKCRVGLVVAMA